jgi:hypothetical protein
MAKILLSAGDATGKQEFMGFFGIYDGKLGPVTP